MGRICAHSLYPLRNNSTAPKARDVHVHQKKASKVCHKVAANDTL